MVIADIAYNKNHFTVFLIDTEKYIPLCSLIFRGCNLNCVSKANKKSINFANTVFL